MIGCRRHRITSVFVLMFGLFITLTLLIYNENYTNKSIPIGSMSKIYVRQDDEATTAAFLPEQTSVLKNYARPEENPAHAAPFQDKPKVGIGFLKVHKAASTTTQAIFLRYGWTRNLTFILPPEYNAFYYPNIISTNESLTSYNILKPPDGKTFDILCHHVVYDKEAWDRYLPENTLRIGTVRQPFILFESMLNYMNPRYINKIKAQEQLGEYLRNPFKYEPNNLRYSYTNNRMAFEYGVDPAIIINKDIGTFKTYLHEVLNKEFDVVIVAERYDESLLLMKRRFNWTLNDIMYAKKNVRPQKSPSRYEMKEGYEDLYKNFSTFDYMLYEFFDEKLSQQITNEGGTFELELKHFQETRKYVESFCHAVPAYIKSVTISKSFWNEQFEITREDCEILHRGEISFTQDIRKVQYGSATWTWR